MSHKTHPPLEGFTRLRPSSTRTHRSTPSSSSDGARRLTALRPRAASARTRRGSGRTSSAFIKKISAKHLAFRRARSTRTKPARGQYRSLSCYERDASQSRRRCCLALIDALAWNWLIAGTDAHAKNYSLLLAGNDVRLAPLYDVASALPYGMHERTLRAYGGRWDAYSSKCAQIVFSTDNSGRTVCGAVVEQSGRSRAKPSEDAPTLESLETSQNRCRRLPSVAPEN